MVVLQAALDQIFVFQKKDMLGTTHTQTASRVRRPAVLHHLL